MDVWPIFEEEICPQSFRPKGIFIKSILGVGDQREAVVDEQNEVDAVAFALSSFKG
jgi:hypothetical protein